MRPHAQKVEVNSAINGDADGNGQDVFRFAAKKGQRIVIDCEAGKLDSMMDATMSLSSADGKLLASNSDYCGRDPLIDFLVPAQGEYLVTVHDLSYRGRLSLSADSQRSAPSGKRLPESRAGRAIRGVDRPGAQPAGCFAVSVDARRFAVGSSGL